MPSEYPEKSLIPPSGRGTSATEKMPVAERRASVRYPFTGTAEVTELRTQVRVAGRTSDLGLQGCYVDTIAPLQAGSAVRVRIEREIHQFEAAATVAFAHRSMGMGLAFTEISPEYKRVLREWIEELSGERLPEPQVGANSPEWEQAPAILSNRQVLNELISLLVRKQIIHEKEGAALLRQLFR